LILFMLAPVDSRLVYPEPLPELLPIDWLTIVARGAPTATPFAEIIIAEAAQQPESMRLLL